MRNSIRTHGQFIFLAAAIIAAGAHGAGAETVPTKRSISLTATGLVSAEPDLATISTGVVSEAKTAREALSDNRAAMRRVIKGLTSSGIERKDIQTTNFSVRPRYRSYRDKRPQSIIGYRVSNSVRIRVRDLENLGAILDQVVTLGSNQIGGIAFEVSNADKLKDEARGRAMASARRKARLFAEAADAELGEVMTIREDVIRSGPRPVLARAVSSRSQASPIEAGQLILQVRVHVTWSLR